MEYENLKILSDIFIVKIFIIQQIIKKILTNQIVLKKKRIYLRTFLIPINDK